AMLLDDPPPRFEWDLHDGGAEPLDRLELGLRRAIRDDRGAGDPHGAGAPGHPLRHVSRARGIDAVSEGRRVREPHRVRRAAELEGPDGLEALELEIDPARRFGNVEGNQGRADRGTGDALPRGEDLLGSGWINGLDRAALPARSRFRLRSLSPFHRRGAPRQDPRPRARPI